MPRTELELQNLRHLILERETASNKMSCYAQDAVTPELKQYFQSAAQTAAESKKELLGFLK